MIFALLKKLALSTAGAAGNAWAALWTSPLVVLAAFFLTWGAEAAQFLFSQGMALALLAWLQALPEFAVEWKLAADAAADPALIHQVTANFTGSIRLIVGFGMPIVYLIYTRFWSKARRTFKPIELDPMHTVEVVCVLPPILYFVYIFLVKKRLDLQDSAILSGFYLFYLYILSKLPPEEEEGAEELGAPARWALSFKGAGRWVAILFFFACGGIILYLTVHPFIEGLRVLAEKVGIPAFFMVQWVAPFLSEMPEKISAFMWATRDRKAPMALMNFLSANINQWTVLVAMIPIVFCAYKHDWSAGIDFDPHQLEEIRLTVVQSALVFVMMANMQFAWYEALGIFVLWVVQFVWWNLRGPIVYVYLAWIAVELLLVLIRVRKWDFPLAIWRRVSRELEEPKSGDSGGTP